MSIYTESFQRDELTDHLRTSSYFAAKNKYKVQWNNPHRKSSSKHLKMILRPRIIKGDH